MAGETIYGYYLRQSQILGWVLVKTLLVHFLPPSMAQRPARIPCNGNSGGHVQLPASCCLMPSQVVAPRAGVWSSFYAQHQPPSLQGVRLMFCLHSITHTDYSLPYLMPGPEGHYAENPCHIFHNKPASEASLAIVSYLIQFQSWYGATGIYLYMVLTVRSGPVDKIPQTANELEITSSHYSSEAS